MPRSRTSSTIPPSSRSCVSSIAGLSGPPGTSDAWGVGVAVGGPVRANVTVSDPAGLGVGVGVAYKWIGMRVGVAVGPGVRVGVGDGYTVGSGARVATGTAVGGTAVGTGVAVGAGDVWARGRVGVGVAVAALPAMRATTGIAVAVGAGVGVSKSNGARLDFREVEDLVVDSCVPLGLTVAVGVRVGVARRRLLRGGVPVRSLHGYVGPRVRQVLGIVVCVGVSANGVGVRASVFGGGAGAGVGVRVYVFGVWCCPCRRCCYSRSHPTCLLRATILARHASRFRAPLAGWSRCR